MASEHDLPIYGLVARFREGQLLGGGAGAALIETTERLLTATGVANAARMCDVIAPGFGSFAPETRRDDGDDAVRALD
jgi:hypothetical protein